MGEKKKQVTLPRIVENLETLQLAAKLQNEGFDLKSYLRDYIDGKAKDQKHYWGKKEG